MSEIEVVKGYVPGGIGRVAELHGTYYAEHWSFGLFFEAKVAAELSEFLERYDERRDGLWSVSVGGRLEGSISIDGLPAKEDGAHLRAERLELEGHDRGIEGHLGDPADVFDPVGISKPEISVEPVTNVVAVKKIGVPSLHIEPLLQQVRDR